MSFLYVYQRVAPRTSGPPGSQSSSPTLRSVLRLRARRHAVAQRCAAVGPGALLAAGLPQHLAAQTWKREQWWVSYITVCQYVYIYIYIYVYILYICIYIYIYTHTLHIHIFTLYTINYIYTHNMYIYICIYMYIYIYMRYNLYSI